MSDQKSPEELEAEKAAQKEAKKAEKAAKKAAKKLKASKYPLEVAPGHSIPFGGRMLQGGDEVKIEMLGKDEGRKARCKTLIERGVLLER